MSLWSIETPSSISTGSVKLLSAISNEVPDTVSIFKGLSGLTCENLSAILQDRYLTG